MKIGENGNEKPLADNQQEVQAWARRFELPTFWSVAKRSIQLSYAHTIFNYYTFWCNAGDRNRTGTGV